MPERQEKIPYPARRKCTSCGKTRLKKFFRLLKSGYRQGMCVDCERAYERQRWHNRPAESKQNSGGAAMKRRHQAAA
jgi:hypothetical protein